MDHYNGTVENVNTFRQQTGVSYPLCLNASATRAAYTAYQGSDVSIVVDQQGVIRYKKAGVNVSEIKGVIDDLLATAIEEKNGVGQQPERFELSQNFPNPFNPATTISFTLPERDFISLEVFDLLGRKIETLIERELDQGVHKFKFEAAGLSSGIYFYKLQGNKFSAIRRMIIQK